MTTFFVTTCVSFLWLVNFVALADITTDLLVFFPLQGNYIDSTGSYSVSYANTDFGPDRFGKAKMAATFNGANQKIVIADLYQPKFYNNDRTISYWFSTTKNDGIAVNIGSDHAYTPYNQQFAIAAKTAGMMVYGGGSPNDFYFSSSGNYVDGLWRHVTAVKNVNNVKLYINGVYIGETAPHQYNTGAFRNQNMEIGMWNDNNRWYGGSISHVRVYTRALSASDVLELYNQDKQNPKPLPAVSNGLQAFFKLAGNYVDETGNNVASFKNAGFASDRFGNAGMAATFNGVNQKITIPVTFPKLLNNDRTISYWFSTTKNDGIAVSIGSDHQNSPWNQQFALSAKTAGVQLYGGGSSNDFIFSNTQNYLDGVWRHFTVVKDGGSVKLYINGNYVGQTSPHSYNTGASNTQNIEIGQWNDNNRWFKGSMSHVRVYTRALSADQVMNLYNVDSQNPYSHSL